MLLATQDQAYKGALETMMKQVYDKISSLESTVGELKRSLEYTQGEVDDLKTEIKTLNKEKEADKTTIQDLQNKCKDAGEKITNLEDRCNYLEDYSRRNNVHITGIEERPDGETWEQTAELVQKLLADKLQLTDLTLDRAHRIGQRTDQRARPIVARFYRYADREVVMRNAKMLRGTQIFFNDDLCPASQEKKREQLPLLKMARSAGKIAYFRHTKLIVRDRGDSRSVVGEARGMQGAGGGKPYHPQGRGEEDGAAAALGTTAAAALGTAAATATTTAAATTAAVTTTDTVATTSSATRSKVTPAARTGQGQRSSQRLSQRSTT